MTYNFGDSFDLYAAAADALNGYWDSGAGTPTFVAGRFAGSQALQIASTNQSLTKSSGVNDAVHHCVVAFRQTAAISGSTLGAALQLFDGATAQCSIVFRSDGAILLTSGVPTGTILATYTGAFPAANTWYAFEFEVVINNTTGSFAARKNGNSVNDFSATALNTRVSANNYANKLQFGSIATTGLSTQQFDDLFWQSGAATGVWLGDIRCYTRMPASDQSVTFSRLSPVTQTPVSPSTSTAVGAGTARYTPFVAAYDGTIGAGTVSLITGYTGNLKCSIFASSGSAPTTVLGSATVVTNPATGSNALTFGTPVAIAKGTQYWIGFDSDTSSGLWSVATGSTGLSSTTAYASFPVASPTTVSGAAIVCSLIVTPSTNYPLVSDPQQDGLTSYVYDSNPGDADWYGLAGTAGTPAYVVATTLRGYMQKPDAGTRVATVQLQSGTTIVATPPSVLTPSNFQWAYRTDVVDPNTGAAWAPSSVNVALIGPSVTA